MQNKYVCHVAGGSFSTEPFDPLGPTNVGCYTDSIPDFRSAANDVTGHSRHLAPQQSARYSITSLARNKIDVGTVRPIALAVLRLMTSSKLVANCTGRSAGFSPLRMRLT